MFAKFRRRLVWLYYFRLQLRSQFSLNFYFADKCLRLFLRTGLILSVVVWLASVATLGATVTTSLRAIVSLQWQRDKC